MSRRHHTAPSVRDLFVEAAYAAIGRMSTSADRIVHELASRPAATLAAEVAATLEDAVANLWQSGWQPADLAHVVAARAGNDAGALVRQVVTAQSRTYADLGRRVAPRWMAEVDDLDDLDGGDGTAYLWQIAASRHAALATAVQLQAFLLQLPALPLLTDPPSKWTEHGPVDADSLPSGVLAKVRALLAKAESTTFDAEAEALTAKAQELMTRHRVDQAMLDRTDPARRRANGAEPVGRRITIDDPYADAKATLLSAVARPNGCRAVWAKPLRHCTVFGFPDELDAVEELFTSLLVQAEQALLREGSKTDRNGRSRTKQFRRSFLVAFAQRIGERLRQTVDQTVEAATAETGTALVPLLAQREEATEAAVTRTFPRLGTFSQSVTDAEGWQAGTAAADRANLTVTPRLPRR